MPSVDLLCGLKAVGRPGEIMGNYKIKIYLLKHWVQCFPIDCVNFLLIKIVYLQDRGLRIDPWSTPLKMG